MGRSLNIFIFFLILISNIAKAEIYKLMRQLADRGVAILMISSDMEEVLGISDRIAVMHEGTITGILDREEFTEENIMHLAVGGSSES